MQLNLQPPCSTILFRFHTSNCSSGYRFIGWKQFSLYNPLIHMHTNKLNNPSWTIFFFFTFILEKSLKYFLFLCCTHGIYVKVLKKKSHFINFFVKVKSSIFNTNYFLGSAHVLCIRVDFQIPHGCLKFTQVCNLNKS